MEDKNDLQCIGRSQQLKIFSLRTISRCRLLSQLQIQHATDCNTPWDTGQTVTTANSTFHRLQHTLGHWSDCHNCKFNMPQTATHLGTLVRLSQLQIQHATDCNTPWDTGQTVTTANSTCHRLQHTLGHWSDCHIFKFNIPQTASHLGTWSDCHNCKFKMPQTATHLGTLVRLSQLQIQHATDCNTPWDTGQTVTTANSTCHRLQHTLEHWPYCHITSHHSATSLSHTHTHLGRWPYCEICKFTHHTPWDTVISANSTCHTHTPHTHLWTLALQSHQQIQHAPPPPPPHTHTHLGHWRYCHICKFNLYVTHLGPLATNTSTYPAGLPD